MSAGFRHHDEASVLIAAPPEAIFDHLDDQTRLGEHMEKPSAMMMGGSMSYAFDDKKGRAVGSVISMTGKMLGLSLSVEEIITDREPPWHKAWETRGKPKLVVIDRYRMGFRLEGAPHGTKLTVFIDYDWAKGPQSFLAVLLARFYARWCVGRMAKDAERRFAPAR
jgi:hypothetical protein